MGKTSGSDAEDKKKERERKTRKTRNTVFTYWSATEKVPSVVESWEPIRYVALRR